MVKIRDKTKKHPIKELTQLRRRISELEASGRKRNQFEEALRLERDKAQNYLDVAEVMLVALNKKGEITLINRKGNQILGYKERELLGKNWFTTCVPSHRRKKLKSKFLELMAGKIKLTEFYEDPALTKAGTERIIAWHNTILKDKSGNMIGTLSSGEDITERKQAEKEIERLSFFPKLNPMPIVEFDQKGQLAYANPAAEQLFPDLDKKQGEHPFLAELKPYFSELREKRKKYIVREVRVDDSWYSQVIVLLDPEHIRIYSADITERKQAAEALRESEATLRALINAPTDSILLLDSQGVILDINKIAAGRLGKSRDKLIGTLADEALPEAIAQRRRSIISQILETGREVRFEDERAGIWYDTVAHPITDNDGMISRVAIIARDITERKKAEKELLESGERYRLLFEEARDGIALADADTGILLDCNQALADLVGRNRAELIGQHQAILHPPSGNNTGISATFKKHLTNKEGQVLETQVLTVAGEIREAEIKANLLSLHGRKMLQGIFRDITERKQAEERLHKSEDKYRTILENIEEGYYEVDLAGNFTFFNDAMCRIWGYPKEELMGMNNRQYTDKENAKKLFRAFNKVYRTGKPGKGYDYEIIKKDGIKSYVESSISLRKDSSGKAIGFRGIIRDITDRKQAEKVVRDSEERFRTLVENASEGIFVQTDYRFAYINSAMLRIFGAERPEQLLGQSVMDRFHPDFGERVRERIRLLNEEKKSVPTLEQIYLRLDGSQVQVEVSAAPIVYNEKNGAVVFVRDITERKRLQETLDKDRNDLKLIIDSSPIIVFYKDKEGRFIRVSKAFAEALKIPEEDFVGKTVFDLYSPKIAQGMADDDKEVFQSRRPKLNIVEKYESSSGIRWAQTDKIPIFDKHGLPIGLIGFAQDITDRKQSEESLRESEEKMKSIFRAAPIGIGVVANRILMDVNTGICEMTGYSREELIGSSARVLYPTQDDFEYVGREKYRQIDEKGTGSVETRWMKKNGTIIDILLSSTPIDLSDRSRGVTFTALDITERKKAEVALRESEEKYRDLVENISDIIYATDESGIVTYISPTIEFISGYAASEIVGRSFLEFVYKEDMSDVVQLFQQDISGQAVPHEYRMVTKSGDVRWARTSSRPFFEGDRIVGLRGILTDITARKQAEEEVKRGYEQLQETLHSTVKALASTVEMKDQYTAGHQPRVTQLACAIAEEMGLSEDQIEGIRMAASIHDIGKIMVPAEILNKPGPLSEIQYEMIKMHPRAGYDILKGLNLPWPVAQIILQHHERLDGSGYPQGLSGEEIMVEARILGVANVVEAMNAHRPYRPAYDIKEALAEISKNRGAFYDATVVDACLRLFTEKGFTLAPVSR